MRIYNDLHKDSLHETQCLKMTKFLRVARALKRFDREVAAVLDTLLERSMLRNPIVSKQSLSIYDICVYIYIVYILYIYWVVISIPKFKICKNFYFSLNTCVGITF